MNRMLAVIQYDGGTLDVTAGGLDLEVEQHVLLAMQMAEGAKAALTEQLVKLRVEKRLSPPVEKEGDEEATSRGAE
jgi:hypothetical protein